MRDKVGTTDQISFTLNGKPVNQQLICPKCGVDRAKNPCPKPVGSWSAPPFHCPLADKE